jgi:hypothetical protein
MVDGLWVGQTASGGAEVYLLHHYPRKVELIGGWADSADGPGGWSVLRDATKNE